MSCCIYVHRPVAAAFAIPTPYFLPILSQVTLSRLLGQRKKIKAEEQASRSCVMAERLTDRTAVITGGSSGIGAATARLFVRHGARVVIADLSSQGVEDHINSEHGAERAKFITCDVSKEEQVKHLFRETVAWAGRLDILCNVAGVVVEGKYGLQARCHEMEVDDFDQAWRVNVRGTWLCSKYTLAQMLEQEPSAANRRGERTRGWIVNVGSISGSVTSVCTSNFADSSQGWSESRTHQCTRHRSMLCVSTRARPRKFN